MTLYGVRHVQVDGWVEVTSHKSLDDAKEDYSTCGWNCAIVERLTIQDSWKESK